MKRRRAPSKHGLNLKIYRRLLALNLLSHAVSFTFPVGKPINMNTTTFPSISFCNYYQISRFRFTSSTFRNVSFHSCTAFKSRSPRIHASSSNELDIQPQTLQEEDEPKQYVEPEPSEGTKPSASLTAAPLDKDLKKVFFFFF